MPPTPAEIIEWWVESLLADIKEGTGTLKDGGLGMNITPGIWHAQPSGDRKFPWKVVVGTEVIAMVKSDADARLIEWLPRVFEAAETLSIFGGGNILRNG